MAQPNSSYLSVSQLGLLEHCITHLQLVQDLALKADNQLVAYFAGMACLEAQQAAARTSEHLAQPAEPPCEMAAA